jgi:hypothetical protein
MIFNHRAAAMGGYLALHTNPPGGLAHYYRENVIGGPAPSSYRSTTSAVSATRCCASSSANSPASEALTPRTRWCVFGRRDGDTRTIWPRGASLPARRAAKI